MLVSFVAEESVLNVRALHLEKDENKRRKSIVQITIQQENFRRGKKEGRERRVSLQRGFNVVFGWSVSLPSTSYHSLLLHFNIMQSLDPTQLREQLQKCHKYPESSLELLIRLSKSSKTLTRSGTHR